MALGLGHRREFMLSLSALLLWLLRIYLYEYIYIYAPPAPPARSIWEDLSPPEFSNPGISSFGGGLASYKFLLKSNWELNRTPGNLESWNASFGGGIGL